MYVYNACHGHCKDGRQEILLNTTKGGDFPIESNLRVFAKETMLVVAIYDCCRDRINSLIARASRGENEGNIASFFLAQ